MFVNRRTFVVNKPYFEEAQGLLVELGKLTKQVTPDVVYRVYASEYDTFDTIAFEFETESLATLEQQLDRWTTDQQIGGRVSEWFKRWLAVTAPGGTNEIGVRQRFVI